MEELTTESGSKENNMELASILLRMIILPVASRSKKEDGSMVNAKNGTMRFLSKKLVSKGRDMRT